MTTVVEVNTLEEITKVKWSSNLILYINPSNLPYGSSNAMEELSWDTSIQNENIPDTLLSTYILNHESEIRNLQGEFLVAFIFKDPAALYTASVLAYQNGIVWITGDRMFIPQSVQSLLRAVGTLNLFIPDSRERLLDGAQPVIPAFYGTLVPELVGPIEYPQATYGVHPMRNWLEPFRYNLISYHLGQNFTLPILLEDGTITTRKKMYEDGSENEGKIVEKPTIEEIVYLKSPLTSNEIQNTE